VPDARRAQPVVRLVAAVAAVVGTALLLGGALLDVQQGAWGLAWFAYPLVGGLILWQRPGNRIGWLLVGIGLCLGGQYLGSIVGPGPVELEVVFAAIAPVAFVLVIAVTALFPTGRSSTPVTTFVTRASVVFAVVIPLTALIGQPLQQASSGSSGRSNPWAVPVIEPLTNALMGNGFLLVPLFLVVSLASLVARWRRSEGVERVQFRWFVFGACFLMVGIASLAVSRTGSQESIIFIVAAGASLSMLPVTIGVAVTRYHLYDIDRVVSRTTSYAIVTGLLLATFALVVALMTTLLPTASSLPVAVATLLAAALARPLLVRIQLWVDRRFNRSRYDAVQTAEAFSARLRHEVDTAHVSADLLAAVRNTLQPHTVGLWLKEPSR
jgi:hypothetical protein